MVSGDSDAKGFFKAPGADVRRLVKPVPVRHADFLVVGVKLRTLMRKQTSTSRDEAGSRRRP
jgi:hypothetical protein